MPILRCEERVLGHKIAIGFSRKIAKKEKIKQYSSLFHRYIIDVMIELLLNNSEKNYAE